MTRQQLHENACALLDVDPQKIRLVGPAEYKAIVGHGVGNVLGRANSNMQLSKTYIRMTGATPPPRVVYVNQKAPYSTFIHEVLHHLFPSRPHWWVYAAARELADVPIENRGQYYGFGRELSAKARKIEDKATLLDLARQASKRRGVY